MCVPLVVTVRLPERAAVKVCYDLSGEAFTSGFALPRQVLYDRCSQALACGQAYMVASLAFILWRLT